MARPGLELAVEVTAADGTQYRWGPGARAGSLPQGLTFKTKQGEGFADGGLTLARRIDREYVDLHLLDDVVISGMDGSIAYEGRVAALPRSMQDTHQVAVQTVGHMAHTRDRKAQEIYVDRDLAGWGDVSRARKVALLTGGEISPDGPAVSTDGGGLAALETTVQGPLQASAFPKTEAVFDAGPGLAIAQVYYDWQRAASTTNASWFWEIANFDTDALTGSSDTTSDLQAEPAATGAAYFVPATARRYVRARLLWNSAAGDAGAVKYSVFWRNLAVYGNHGVSTIGTHPRGVAASDVIRHVIGKYCPKLNADGVQATTYPIPHLSFKDRVDPYDIILEVNKHHLWQFGVYERRTLFYGPVDMSDYDWEVRLSDKGTKIDLQGDSSSTLANGIVVTYQDVATGTQGVLTPDNYPELRDPNAANPATLAGINVWTEISLSSPSTQDAALQIGRAALAEFNQPRAPGTISVQGYIRDRAGHLQPVWKVRNGDRIIIADHPNDRARLVVESDYQHDSKTVSIAVDSSFKRLDAVLDRFGTALRAAGLGS